MRTRFGKFRKQGAYSNHCIQVCRLTWHHIHVAACPNPREREFEEVRRDLEETVAKLKESHPPESRRSLLLNLRLLLMEADEIIAITD